MGRGRLGEISQPAQIFLNLFKTDLYKSIDSQELVWTGFEVLGDDLDNFIFHAGTINKNEKILAVGGRVLNFVSLSNDFKLAKKNIENNLEKLNWTGGFFRRDIGYKVIE